MFKFKKMFFRGMVFMLAVVTAFPCPASAAAVNPDSDATTANIMEYANTWDVEAAHFFNEVAAGGEDITQWWSAGEGLGLNMETAVHEECHEYTSQDYWYLRDRIYAGDGQDIYINYGDFYDTSLMAEELPEELRTFRFDTYVSTQASEGLSKAAVDGIYGLMDEYNAYSWGMNTALCMFDFLKASDADADTWMNEFVNSASNNVLAYAEFNFWILGYMAYAKENKPKCYKSALNNKELMQAYFTVTSRFESMLEEFEILLDELPVVLAEQGYTASFDHDGFQYKDTEYIYTYSFTHIDDDWEVLLTEVQKPEYQEVLAEMQQAYPDITVTGIVPDGSICGARAEGVPAKSGEADVSEAEDGFEDDSSQSVTIPAETKSTTSSSAKSSSDESEVLNIVAGIFRAIITGIRYIILYIAKLAGGLGKS